MALGTAAGDARPIGWSGLRRLMSQAGLTGGKVRGTVIETSRLVER
ncbi:MAG: hypothetical protein AAF281_13875 [Pseudomonadota bacterium]